MFTSEDIAGALDKVFDKPAVQGATLVYVVHQAIRHLDSIQEVNPPDAPWVSATIIAHLKQSNSYRIVRGRRSRVFRHPIAQRNVTK